MQPPTALSSPPSLAACYFAEYVGGLFGNAAASVSLQRSRLVGLTDTAAALGLDNNNCLLLVSSFLPRLDGLIKFSAPHLLTYSPTAEKTL